MDLNIKALRYFVAIAEHGSFTKAAAVLHVAQPSISERIRALETLLNCEVFRRSPNGVELTLEGQLLLPQARALVAQANRIGRFAMDIARDGQNILRIGAMSNTVNLPHRSSLIDDFVDKYPKADLRITNGLALALLDRVDRGEDDVAIVLGPLGAGDFQYVTLCEVELGLLMPKDHPLARFDEVPLAALADLRMVALPREVNPPFFDLVFRVFQDAGAVLTTLPEIDSHAMVRFAQAHHICSASFDSVIMPYELEALGIVKRRLAGSKITTTLAAVRAPSQLRPVAEKFWEFTMERFGPPRQVAHARAT